MLPLSGQVQRLHSIHPTRRSPKRSISISGPLQRGQRLSTKGFILYLSVNGSIGDFTPAARAAQGQPDALYHSYERGMTNGYPKNLRLAGLAPPRAPSVGSVRLAVMRVDSA